MLRALTAKAMGAHAEDRTRARSSSDGVRRALRASAVRHSHEG